MLNFLPLKIFHAFISIVIISVTFSLDVNSPKTLYVDSYRQPCPENSNTYCLRVRENKHNQWIPLALQIEGFNYQEGVNYELLVYKEVPSGKIVLVEIVNQEVIPILKPEQDGALEIEAKIEPIDNTQTIKDENVAEKSTDRNLSSKDTDNAEVTRQPTQPAVNIISDTGFSLTGVSWQLKNIEVESRLVTPIEKSKYTLNLKADGSLTTTADCYTGSGDYAFNSEKISLDINYSNEACEAESLAEIYREGLEQTSSYIIEDNKLHFLYGENSLMTFTAIPLVETAVSETTKETNDSSGPKLEPTIENNLWLLNSIDKGDQTKEIEGNYSIRLSDDNLLKVYTDCYQGSGNYSLEGSYISFEFSIEHKACSPESLSEEFADQLKDAEVYSLQGNKLYIRTKTSGDVMVFLQNDAPEDSPISENSSISTEPPVQPTKETEFKTIKIEALAIKSLVPTNWSIVTKHPFFNNVWATGPFNYIGFESLKGTNDLEILSQNLKLSSDALAKEAIIETFGNYRWRLYLDKGPVISLAIATTVEKDNVYAITILGTEEAFSEIVQTVLKNFEVLK